MQGLELTRYFSFNFDHTKGSFGAIIVKRDIGMVQKRVLSQ